MAKKVLPENYKDDILTDEMNGRRKYNFIQNQDGTYSLVDVTDYAQIGSTIGASQINDITKAVNNLNQDLEDYEYNKLTVVPSKDIESGDIRIEKKNGWCHVFGPIKPITIDGTTITVLSGLPKPRSGIAFGQPLAISSATYLRPLHITITAEGDLTARYGSHNNYYIDTTYCYIEE